jgi:hypothetical protein
MNNGGSIDQLIKKKNAWNNSTMKESHSVAMGSQRWWKGNRFAHGAHSIKIYNSFSRRHSTYSSNNTGPIEIVLYEKTYYDWEPH